MDAGLPEKVGILRSDPSPPITFFIRMALMLLKMINRQGMFSAEQCYDYPTNPITDDHILTTSPAERMVLIASPAQWE